jgi:hypothetical protein
MSNKKPKTAHLSPWKKGQSGNAKGRPKKILKILKDSGYTKADVLHVFEQMGWKDQKQINAVLQNKKSPAIVLVIAQAFVKAIRSGEYRYVNEILQYTIGKPVEEHKHEIDATMIFRVGYKKLEDEEK